MDDSRIPKQVFYGQLHHGSRRPDGQYKWYEDCLKSTLNRCGIAPSELESLVMTQLIGVPRSRQQWESLKHDASRSWSVNGIYASLVYHPPETLSARSATGCVVHGSGRSGFLPTTNPTRDDETRRIHGSVHESARVGCTNVNSSQLFRSLLHQSQNYY